MATLVLDSSVAAAWCFTDEATSYTEAVLSAVSALTEAAAPRLWAYEIRNTVLMGVRRTRITRADAAPQQRSVTVKERLRRGRKTIQPLINTK